MTQKFTCGTLFRDSMQRRGGKGIGKENSSQGQGRKHHGEKSQASYSLEHIHYSDQLAETKVQSQSMDKLLRMHAACVRLCVW